MWPFSAATGVTESAKRRGREPRGEAAADGVGDAALPVEVLRALGVRHPRDRPRSAAASARRARSHLLLHRQVVPSASQQVQLGQLAGQRLGCRQAGVRSRAVTRASATVSSTRRSRPPRERSAVVAEASRWPRRCGGSSASRGRASATRSRRAGPGRSGTPPPPGRRRPRPRPAARAPPEKVAEIWSSIALQTCVPPTVMPSIRIVGKPDADRHRLAVLAAGADALVEPEVVADPAHPRQDVGPRSRSAWRP